MVLCQKQPPSEILGHELCNVMCLLYCTTRPKTEQARGIKKRKGVNAGRRNRLLLHNILGRKCAMGATVYRTVGLIVLAKRLRSPMARREAGTRTEQDFVALIQGRFLFNEEIQVVDTRA